MDMKSIEAQMLRLKAKMDALGTEAAALKAADRADEASLKKAQANIYGICLQLLPSLPEDAFLQQMEKLRTAWVTARETAAAHGDFARVAMEDGKLEALADAISLMQAREEGTIDA